MKKVLLGLLVICTLLLSCANSYAEEEKPPEQAYRVAPLLEKLKTYTAKTEQEVLKKFSDVEGHWGRSYLGKAVYLEIMGGYPDNTIKPDNKVQVDEFLAMTIKSMGYKPEKGDGYWAQPYINSAVETKIIGINDFSDYKKTITRQEAARIVVNAALMKDPAPEPGIVNLLIKKIPDYPYIGDKYKQTALQVYAMGIMTGDSKMNFNPKGNLKRAEAAVILYKGLDSAARKPYVPSEKDYLALPMGLNETFFLAPSTRYPETFEFAKWFKANYDKTKGITAFGYSPEYEMIACMYVNDEASYNRMSDISNGIGHPEMLDMSMELAYTGNKEGHTYFYAITMHNLSNCETTHAEVIEEFLKYLAGTEYKKADTLLKEYIKYGKDVSDRKEKTVTINGRKFRAKTMGGDVELAVSLKTR
jgi:hypothetical protein